MQLRTFVLFVLVIVGYFMLSYASMLEVVHRPEVHDYWSFDFDEEILRTIANSIPIASVVYRVSVANFRQLDIYAMRVILLYFLKGILQFVTVVPAADGVVQCANRSFWTMMIAGNCADMMFSGHAGLTLLMTTPRWRPIAFLGIGTLLILTNLHYTSDILVVPLAIHWIESTVPISINGDYKMRPSVEPV